MGAIGVISLAAATNSSPFMEPFRLLAIAYCALWLALKPSGYIQKFNRLGDYSFGLFIYHWPIAQSLLHLFPSINYLMLLMTMLPLTLGFAILSWHLIEAPMLAKLMPWRERVHAKGQKLFAEINQGYHIMAFGEGKRLQSRENEARQKPRSSQHLKHIVE